jgi:hypothetical protein
MKTKCEDIKSILQRKGLVMKIFKESKSPMNPIHLRFRDYRLETLFFQEWNRRFIWLRRFLCIALLVIVAFDMVTLISFPLHENLLQELGFVWVILIISAFISNQSKGGSFSLLIGYITPYFFFKISNSRFSSAQHHYHMVICDTDIVDIY